MQGPPGDDAVVGQDDESTGDAEPAERDPGPPPSCLNAPTGDFWVARPRRISAVITGRPTSAMQPR